MNWIKEIKRKIEYYMRPICTADGQKVRCEKCGRYMRLGYWHIGGGCWYACPKDGKVLGQYSALIN